LLAFFGTASSIFGRKKEKLYFVFMFIFSFLLGVGVIALENALLKEVFGLFFINRGFAYMGVFAAVMGGFAVASFYQGMLKKIESKAAILLIIFVGIFLLINPYLQTLGGNIKVESDFPANNYLQEAADWLGGNTPEYALIGVEESVGGVGLGYGEFGFIDLDSAIPIYSGRAVLYGNFHEATKSSAHGNILFRLQKSEPEALSNELTRFGVSYVITSSKGTYNSLKNSDSFELEFENEKLAIWKIVPRSDDGNLLKRENLLEFKRDAGGFKFSIENFDSDRLILPINYNKKWEASFNNRQVKLIKTADSLIEIENPESGQVNLKPMFRNDALEKTPEGLLEIEQARTGKVNLELVYKDNKVDLLSRLITLITIAVTLLAFLKNFLLSSTVTGISRMRRLNFLAKAINSTVKKRSFDLILSKKFVTWDPLNIRVP
jgi:hypothetical protein